MAHRYSYELLIGPTKMLRLASIPEGCEVIAINGIGRRRILRMGSAIRPTERLTVRLFDVAKRNHGG